MWGLSTGIKQSRKRPIYQHFRDFIRYSNSAQGNLFPLSVALFQAFAMAVFLPFITIILFFQNFRYHSGIMNEYQRTY
jgi:hypothetical protein